MEKDKMKVLLYLKKSGLDKSGQAPIMGRITHGRTIAQFSCKLSCDPKLWNARESRLNGKSREAVLTNGKLERLLLSVQSAYRVLCGRGIVFTGQTSNSSSKDDANSNHLFGAIRPNGQGDGAKGGYRNKGDDFKQLLRYS